MVLSSRDAPIQLKTPATLHDMVYCVQLAQSPQQSKVLVGIVDVNCSLVQHSQHKYSATRILFPTVGKDTKAARDAVVGRVPFVLCVSAVLRMCQPNHQGSRCARC